MLDDGLVGVFVHAFEDAAGALAHGADERFEIADGIARGQCGFQSRGLDHLLQLANDEVTQFLPPDLTVAFGVVQHFMVFLHFLFQAKIFFHWFTAI